MGGHAVSFGPRQSRQGLPPWIRKQKLRLGDLHEIKSAMRRGGLSTVCEEARCPNRSECFSRHTATFLINGRICTRNCAYCSVGHGRPNPLDPGEAEELVAAVQELGLDYVVITSVDRDDLPDGGASGFLSCIAALKQLPAVPRIEVLTPDFRAETTVVDRIIAAEPDVYNHNIETVRSLYPRLRPSGRYDWALAVLRRVAERAPAMLRKSGLMVGLGERREEISETLRDLAGAGCQVVTIGQYLRPTPAQVEVARYLEPTEFEELGEEARSLGMLALSGPFVRSSYRAGEAFEDFSAGSSVHQPSGGA